MLLNRLSNNADSPGLSAGNNPDSARILPHLLDWSLKACALMAGLEIGEDHTAYVDVHPDEVRKTYERLTSSTPPEQKLDAWLKLGRRVGSDGKVASRLLVSVPAARDDLLSRDVPKSLRPDAGHGEDRPAMLRALRDFLKGETVSDDEAAVRGERYATARRTLLMGHRLIAVQTALLAARAHAVPIQAPDVGPALYRAVSEVKRAVSTASRKGAHLFRRLEVKLAEALPATTLSELAEGRGPIVIYSDLPFEWTEVDGWPLCLSRPVSRVAVVGGAWRTLINALERPVKLDARKPERVLLVDLIPEHDRIRHYTDRFQGVAAAIGHRYARYRPTSKDELHDALTTTDAQVVVLDAHGRYDDRADRLEIGTGSGFVWADEYLPDGLVPPVWILSACETSVVGSIRGTLVWELLRRGAICVIASLTEVDAFTAAVFVGRLLADIYSPPRLGLYQTLADALFSSQATTALLYDPMLPLIRRAEAEPALEHRVRNVLLGFLREVGNQPLDPKTHRVRAAELLWKHVQQQGLADLYMALTGSNEPLPQTLLFSAFGFPSAVQLTTGGGLAKEGEDQIST